MGALRRGRRGAFDEGKAFRNWLFHGFMIHVEVDRMYPP